VDGLVLVVSKQSVTESEQTQLVFVVVAVFATFQTFVPLALVDISETIVNSLVALEN